MAKKKDNRVILVRNTIIGFITVVAILIFGFGTYVSTGLAEGEITAEDYREVDRPKPRRQGEPIEVVEFFAYTCVHCKNFDPIIEDWADDQPDDVKFSRQPAMWSPIQNLLGQTYLTLESLGALEDNHARIFRALHDAGRQFLTPEMMADYVDGRGVERDAFLREFNSPRIKQALRDANRENREFQISATPSIMVGGRYVVSMNGGGARALDVVEYLLEKIRTEEAGTG